MEEMEEFLKEHELENYIETFKENDVTLEIAKKLSPNEIKELIPSIGKRQVFTSALKEVTLNEFIVGDSNFLVETNKDGSTISLDTIESIQLQGDLAVVNEHRNIAFCGIENFEIPTLPDFDLKTLLDTTPLGLTVINYYKKNQRLNNSKRRILVDIITKKIFNFIVKHRMTHGDYNLISAKILLLFPKECMGTYYVPAVGKKRSLTNKSIIAKGKLVDKVRNLLRLNRDINSDIEKNTETPETSSNSLNYNVKELDKSWLEIRSEPRTEVISKWQNTVILRRRRKYNDVQEFLNDWPVLKNISNVNELIYMDFDELFPNLGLNLRLNWFFFMDKILSMKKLNVKDQYSLNLLELLEDSTEDTAVAIHLNLLPILIPPKGRTCFKNKNWKFSGGEVLESFLLHSVTVTETTQLIEKHNRQVFEKKGIFQPFILIEGQSLREIKNIFVVAGDKKFQFDSLITALDFNFKLFHVGNFHYPIESEYLWLMIQKCVYSFDTEHDKVIPYILDIIQAIKEN
ncbi:unnamed protein product [Brassicogethes aeneus]|uniref:SAM domain-containing protein n=1 Tax=Brassicogethes aeneus TaxID=1431903 RepID=A0A9P0BET3_BRAAE|nr:unnamed protein product [Brassicogethes aeneus]